MTDVKMRVEIVDLTGENLKDAPLLPNSTSYSASPSDDAVLIFCLYIARCRYLDGQVFENDSGGTERKGE